MQYYNKEYTSLQEVIILQKDSFKQTIALMSKDFESFIFILRLRVIIQGNCFEHNIRIKWSFTNENI